MTNDAAVTFAVVLPGLLVAHQVADHWLQTNRQVRDKGRRGWPGRKACAAHVATYTVATASVVVVLWTVFGLQIAPLGFVVGQLVSGISHYWADRGFTLQRLCEVTGKGAFYRLGAPRATAAVTEDDRPVRLYRADGVVVAWDNPSLGTGAYVLDQSWHWAWLLVAALVTAVVR